MIRWRWVASLAAMIGAFALLTAGSPITAVPEKQLVLTGHRGQGSHDLIVSGAAMGDLYPGAVRRIPVTFGNPNHFAIDVVAARGELARTSRRGCKPIASNLTIRDYHGRLPLRIAPKSRRSDGYIEVKMPNSVSPACQNTHFSVRLIGKATKAGR